MIPKDDPTSIGSILLAMDAVNKYQLDEAVRDQRASKEDVLLGVLLVHKGYCTRDQLSAAIDKQASLRGNNRSKRALALADIALGRKPSLEVYKSFVDKVNYVANKVETGEFPRVLANTVIAKNR